MKILRFSILVLKILLIKKNLVKKIIESFLHLSGEGGEIFSDPVFRFSVVGFIKKVEKIGEILGLTLVYLGGNFELHRKNILTSHLN